MSDCAICRGPLSPARAALGITVCSAKCSRARNEGALSEFTAGGGDVRKEIQRVLGEQS